MQTPDALRWRMLIVLSIAELLAMSVWFAGSAVAGDLAARLGMDASGIAWISIIVQVGFVVGTAASAVFNFSDIISSRALFVTCAFFAALANFSLASASTPVIALALRFLTGFFLAGVYPPAMKMVATWFQSRRGLAIGSIVGALTLGKAAPYLISAIPGATTTRVVTAASGLAFAGAVVVLLLYRDGPYAFQSRPFSWTHVRSVVRVREWRLATASYLGHMFELYAFWTWIPVYLAASAAGTGVPVAAISLIAFLTIAVGGAGCVWGGLFADRHGRTRLVQISLIVSGGCCILSAFAFGRALPLVAALTLVWGFFVIADSAQFSALVTEAVPGQAVGTALTLQVSLGFLLTIVPMQALPLVAEALGWRFAFPILALGPVAGIAAIRALGRMPLAHPRARH